jgi:hypothetical protein
LPYGFSVVFLTAGLVLGSSTGTTPDVDIYDLGIGFWVVSIIRLSPTFIFVFSASSSQLYDLASLRDAESGAHLAAASADVPVAANYVVEIAFETYHFMSVIPHSDVLHVNLSVICSRSYKYRDFVAMLPMARANGWVPVVPGAGPYVLDGVGDYCIAPPRPPMIIRSLGFRVQVGLGAFLCTMDVHFGAIALRPENGIVFDITYEDPESGSILIEPVALAFLVSWRMTMFMLFPCSLSTPLRNPPFSLLFVVINILTLVMYLFV